MSNMNIFFAHPKNIDNNTLGSLANRAYQLALVEFEGKIVNLIPARKDGSAMHHGDWDKWEDSVIKRYHCVVLTNQIIGKSTASVCTKMLNNGGKVYLLAGDVFLEVSEIMTMNEKSWKDGFLAIPDSYEVEVQEPAA